MEKNLLETLIIEYQQSIGNVALVERDIHLSVEPTWYFKNRTGIVRLPFPFLLDKEKAQNYSISLRNQAVLCFLLQFVL